MTDAVVTLKKGEGRYLQKGGPWIYDNEIADISPGAEDGGLVRVCGENGWPLGQGFLNRRSKLTVRMLTRDPDAEINEDFFLMRLKNAWEYRKKVVDTSSCRLVFGEADFLPGLVVDKFSDVLELPPGFRGGGLPAGAGGGQVLRRAGGRVPGSGHRPLQGHHRGAAEGAARPGRHRHPGRL